MYEKYVSSRQELFLFHTLTLKNNSYVTLSAVLRRKCFIKSGWSWYYILFFVSEHAAPEYISLPASACALERARKGLPNMVTVSVLVEQQWCATSLVLVWNSAFRDSKALLKWLSFLNIFHIRLKYYLKNNSLFFFSWKKTMTIYFVFAETIIKQNMKINYMMNWNKSDWKLIWKLSSFEMPLGKCMNEKTGKEERDWESYIFLWRS